MDNSETLKLSLHIATQGENEKWLGVYEMNWNDYTFMVQSAKVISTLIISEKYLLFDWVQDHDRTSKKINHPNDGSKSNKKSIKTTKIDH